jgi:hypothetical protein
MEKKKIIKNVLLRGTADGATGKFTQYINVPFVPDMLKVKCAYYYQDGNQDGYLFSDLVRPGDQVLSMFVDGKTYDGENRFIMDKPVNGTYNFEFRSTADALQTALTGRYYFHLEFSKNA